VPVEQRGHPRELVTAERAIELPRHDGVEQLGHDRAVAGRPRYDDTASRREVPQQAVVGDPVRELAAAERRGREPGGPASDQGHRRGQNRREAILALADIKTTHSAFPADEGYGYRRRGWHDDHDEDDDEYSGGASDSEREYDIQELIDSDITRTHWTGPAGV
jgi:hypothetical protein